MPDLSLSTWIWLLLTGALSLFAFPAARRFILRNNDPLIERLKRHELLSGLCCMARDLGAADTPRIRGSS
ncbi:MAG: hypothetical protein C1O27_002399 [Chloroflexi bacterium]|jgi:hypothetical protein|nr:MAG: hypothetical protein C1O27_002399 [Chloroflexota bacterium]